MYSDREFELSSSKGRHNQSEVGNTERHRYQSATLKTSRWDIRESAIDKDEGKHASTSGYRLQEFVTDHPRAHAQERSRSPHMGSSVISSHSHSGKGHHHRHSHSHRSHSRSSYSADSDADSPRPSKRKRKSSPSHSPSRSADRSRDADKVRSKRDHKRKHKSRSDDEDTDSERKRKHRHRKDKERSRDRKNERRSVLTGKKIKLKVHKDKDDYERDANREHLLQFLNSTFE